MEKIIVLVKGENLHDISKILRSGPNKMFKVLRQSATLFM